VTMLVCFLLFTHEAAGASSARHSLRPLIFRERDVHSKTRAGSSRDREAVFRRHCEERSDEAIQNCRIRALDCFAEPVIGRACARPVGSQ
jgi:hypothetical protein